MHHIITIDPEFQALCPPLLPEEREQLETSLRQDGCRDPLVVWCEPQDIAYCKQCYEDRSIRLEDGRWICEACGFGVAPEIYFLLDGHNRYAICQQHQIAYETYEIEIDTRAEAINWIIANQLGRRNLTPEQKSYLRGKRYNIEKTTKGRPEKTDNNEPFIGTQERLATEYKVSPGTIKRDGQFASALDTLEAEVRQDIRDVVLSRQERAKQQLTKKQATQAGQLVQNGMVTSLPFMQRATWKPSQVLDAIERLAELPQDEHQAINRLLEGPFIPAEDGLQILTNLATMPEAHRQHIYGLRGSPEKRQHDIAIALAAAKAPPPDPQSQLADAMLLAMEQVQQRLRRNWINVYPNEAWSDALRDVEGTLLRLMQHITTIQSQVHTAHKERMATYAQTV